MLINLQKPLPQLMVLLSRYYNKNHTKTLDNTTWKNKVMVNIIVFCCPPI